MKECGCLQNNTVVFGDNAYYNTDRIMNERGVDMCSVAVKIPDEVLYDTKMTEAEANAFAKRATALMLYTQNHIRKYIVFINRIKFKEKYNRKFFI